MHTFCTRPRLSLMAALLQGARGEALIALRGLQARSIATAAVTHATIGVQAGSKAPSQTSQARWRRSERFHRLATVSSFLSSPDPGRKSAIDEMIRVDHSGETAAVRIYEGQVSSLTFPGACDGWLCQDLH